MQDPLYEQLSDGIHEFSFNWSQDNCIISGKVDWVKPYQNSFEIIDFKTDRISPEEIEAKAKDYELQLCCYALALEASTEYSIQQASLYFLHTGQTHTIKMTNEFKQKALKKIETITQKIRNLKFQVDLKNVPCLAESCTCPFHINSLCWLDQSKK